MTQDVDTAQPGVAHTSTVPFGRPYTWVFVDDRFVSSEDARVSVGANTLSYGTGTFEGIRASWNEGLRQLFLLEPDAHYHRMEQSAHILGLELPKSSDQLTTITAELLRRNDVRTDAYIRPLFFLAEEQFPVRMHGITAQLTVAATPIPGDYINSRGVRCMVSSWRRSPDVAVPNRAKVIGSYAGPALAKTEAIHHGFDEAIMLTVDGYVAEATTSNIFIRFADSWVTPPVTDDILEGITRRQVMQLIREETGTPVTERRILRSELYTCDEALLCGTAAMVVPILEVDGRRVGNGLPGKQTLALQQRLRTIARREEERHPEWTTPVYSGDEEEGS
ncbi:MAG: branched-chain amino acid transaminase [Streptosporangiales bacterium]|nr:branched-chain amino acid transaminase [Streptosporangiales bacterium]